MAEGKVVVVTGASSGMGRKTAEKLLARGDRVVLAARRRDALEAVARSADPEGARSLVVPTDVSDEQQVEDLVAQAAARFGRVDACVHAAAVAAYGHLWEVPPASQRRLVEVNVVGSMLVARAMVRQFLRQDEGGTLVLVSSVLGRTPLPYLGVYATAKHGVVGLATSLRADLKEAGLASRVRVSNVMPPSTDTPFYVHAANYADRAPRPPPPVYDVGTLADVLVRMVDEPEEDVAVGVAGKLMVGSHALAPSLYERATGPYASVMFLDEPGRPTDGNLFQPMPEGRTGSGGWKEGSFAARRREATR